MALSTTNILIYSAQILVLICAAAIGAAIFRLPLARARLAYWRVVVIACLVLPWVSLLVSVPPTFVSPQPISSTAFGITPETVSGSSLFTRFVPLLMLLAVQARNQRRQGSGRARARRDGLHAEMINSILSVAVCRF